MNWDEFQQEKRKFVLGNEKMQKISECQWDEAFCVLPPYKYCVINGVEMFCSSEMFTGTYTKQYAQYRGEYYCKMVDSTDESTWIHNDLTKGQ